MVITEARLDLLKGIGNRVNKNLFLLLTGLPDPVIFLYKISDI